MNGGSAGPGSAAGEKLVIILRWKYLLVPSLAAGQLEDAASRVELQFMHMSWRCLPGGNHVCDWLNPVLAIIIASHIFLLYFFNVGKLSNHQLCTCELKASK